MIPARLFLLALAPALLAQQAPEPDPLAAIPGVERIYYDVKGTSPAAIRKDMNGKRPTDMNDGRRVDALGKWHYRWRWRVNGSGKCDLNSVELTFSGTVTLPRLADEARLSRPVRERWARYYRALLEHEHGHIGYAYAQRDAVLAALKGATCETANDAGKAALDRIRAHDRDYDARTRHGATQGAVFP